ncbi:hypothetical protein SCLCIDRAFT_875245 [Scleroderma citrinum Foug A]|uniref:Uncharacterized protein n=1 Tax=Scleroderma citrinum Foug A TaxID=1036808 RepID=A0A0C2ZIR0_9AGAM|nr:hypothetical protein SCLCIDRAFT_875245 [Scleroderma citrinum Foug A]
MGRSPFCLWAQSPPYGKSSIKGSQKSSEGFSAWLSTHLGSLHMKGAITTYTILQSCDGLWGGCDDGRGGKNLKTESKCTDERFGCTRRIGAES